MRGLTSTRLSSSRIPSASQELTGQIELGGNDLHGALARLISSNAYQRTAPANPGDAINSPRLQMVQGIIRSYREAATMQLQKEFPRIKQEIRAYQQDQLSMRRGQQASALAKLVQQDRQQ